MIDSAARLARKDAAPGQAAAWAGLRLHQVRYVLAAAECGGFRRAARRLGVQQSAVSRRIQELEDRLGARLFERGPTGVLLTAAGRDFVQGAHGALAELDRAVDQVTDLARGDQGTLRIGILAPLGPGPLDDLLRRAVAGAPDLALQVFEAGAEVHLESLARGRLDLAFLPHPSKGPGLEARPAWRERLVVALPVEDPLAARRTVRWRDLADRRLLLPAETGAEVKTLVDRRLGRAGGGRVASQPAGHATVLRLVALGQGAALVSETEAIRVTGVIYRPVAREVLAYDTIVSRRPQKPALRKVLALIESAWG